MGKRQIGEMQPFEFIVTLIIADLACIPMADVSIPLIYGIASILGLFVLHQVFSLLERRGKLFKQVISGKPSIVLNKDGVDIKELKKNNMGVEDLIESMRSNGYFSFDDLDYAIFESNGKLSAMESANKSVSSASLPVLILKEGKFSLENLKVINKTADELTTYLIGIGTSPAKTEVMTVDGNGRVYLKVKNSKFQILHLNLSGDIEW